MNILYVIGNGFDLNLNLNTSYEHFFEYYKNQTNKNEIISKLKESIKGKKKDWSDLELTLGEYFKEISSEEEFDLIFDDIKFNLSQYLRDQEANFDISDINYSKFFEYLIYPDKNLLLSDQIELKLHFERWKNNEINIQITTFNYTGIIDKLVQDKVNKVPIGNRYQKVNFSRILHIHGFVDNHMILGVNDASQMSNDEFINNSYIMSSFIKEECNKIFKNEKKNIFKDQISNANLIIIFGCSLGDSDKIWWERIANRLNDECKLILFKKGPDIPPLQEHKLFKYENQIKEYFLEKANVSDLNKANYLKEKIFVGINTDIFKLIATTD